MVERTTITAQKSLLRLPDGTYIVPFTNSSSALEIGDIGQTLFVDETKGTRRILNGQLVEINANTMPFLNYLKSVQLLFPQLFVTEDEWQSERASSAFNQIGKFVFNYDEAGENVVSVRIPAIINVQGLYDLANTGLRVDEALPNITGYASTETENNAKFSGALKQVVDKDGLWNSEPDNAAEKSEYNCIQFNASWSNEIYKDNAHVQQEAIQYPYFIQIAHEQYTTPIRNEWQTINPYALFDYRYSYYPLSNLSWLISNKQQNTKQLYPTVYEALCVELNDAIQTHQIVNLPSGGKYTKHLQTLYYDQSKLTLVGSPSITSSGELKSSNDNNYVKLDINTAIATATDYILKLRFQYIPDSTIFSTSISVVPNALQVLCVGNKIETRISLTNTDWDFIKYTNKTFIEGQFYDLKLSFNQTTGYKFEISEDLGLTYDSEWLLDDNTRLAPESNFLLFGASYNIPGTTIDLKTIQFTYDGITINCNRQENLVWNGAEHSATEADYDKKFIVDTVNETFRLPLLVDRELNNGEILYFYVGDIAQNSALVDVGRLTEQLAILKAEVEKLKG